MLVIHANDPTTKVLSRLYESREDFHMRLDEHSSNAAVIRAVKDADSIMMLGHGNSFGLFSTPDKKGQYRRLLVQGLFSGMIISELHEAEENNIPASQEEVDTEMERFVIRLRYCIETGELQNVPTKMLELDDAHSPLTEFNYKNLYYYV